MHAATRLSASHIRSVVRDCPGVHVCCFGLYAAPNESYLRGLGTDTVLAGEFEPALVALYQRLVSDGGSPAQAGSIHLERLRFPRPDRAGLPALDEYARLRWGGEERVVGYTEASRGCLHRCRHCPVVPVYNGRFFVVQQQTVMADIDQQVAAGARHITFGDPDFFNGIGHSLRIVTEMHQRHPQLTFDVTVKVEHLLRHARHLPQLRKAGCIVVTSAVESVDDELLLRLEKGHTFEDFVQSVHLLRQHDLVLNPTFIPFTPWDTAAGYLGLLRALVELDLVDYVTPIQLGMRLLIPRGSRLLEVVEGSTWLGDFDAVGLSYTWTHPDSRMDRLQKEVMGIVEAGSRVGRSRRDSFSDIWNAAHRCEAPGRPVPPLTWVRPPVTVPFLTEPWYC